MKGIKKNISSSLMLLLVLHMMVSGSCSSRKVVRTWYADAGEYAYVEYFITMEGKAIEGVPPPGLRIDGPTFVFEKERGILTSYLMPDFDKDTVRVILGLGLIRRGTEGGGMSSRLEGLKELPFRERKFVLQEMSKDSIRFSFEGQKYTLGLGKSWSKDFESVDTIPSIDGKAVLQRRVLHQVNFHGYYSKDKLNFRDN